MTPRCRNKLVDIARGAGPGTGPYSTPAPLESCGGHLPHAFLRSEVAMTGSETIPPRVRTVAYVVALAVGVVLTFGRASPTISSPRNGP
jgi:hypothetical protein